MAFATENMSSDRTLQSVVKNKVPQETDKQQKLPDKETNTFLGPTTTPVGSISEAYSCQETNTSAAGIERQFCPGEFTFFDPYDPSCQEILFDTKTTTPELFAILRQWVPQVQQNIDIIGKEILRRGCNVNDRDGLTDMTLLHYTCKAGAQGIGDAETAAKFASHLISLGADVTLRSRWTNMNALHYAAYFDVPELITVILKSSKPKDVDATCSDFDFGTALHIAASNLCIGAVKCLLGHGANPAFKNEKGQIPADVISNPVDMPLEMADAAAIAKELKQMLLDAVTLSCDISRAMPLNFDHVSGQAFLKSLGIKLGDRVSIAGQKIGSLRFCGPTQFAGGQWAGIELDDPEGKNDGSVGGVQYFKCPLKHGIFAPLSKISKAADHKKSTLKTLHQLKSTYKLQKTDLSRVTSKLDTGSVTSKPLTCTESKVISPSKEVAKSQGGGRGLWSRAISMGSVNSDETDIKLGDRVLVVGQRTGVVRFCGKTSFAPGCWYGIELDKPHGKNDGSVGGVRYFTCAAKHGVFAPPSRVQRITDSMDSLSDIPASKLNHSFPGFRRSLSSSSTVSSQNDQNRLKSFSSKKPIFRRSWSSTSGGSSEGTVKLRKGSQVLLVSSNEMATVRYIGPTDFASGIWLGLELKSPKGKNDGSVGEKRYFTCKQNYGVLVRPTRVTYRGINGGKLVDDIS